MTTKPLSQHEIALSALRVAMAAMQEKMPGTPCVSFDLGKVHIFTGEDGEMRGVIAVQELIYLVDGILRRAPKS